MDYDLRLQQLREQTARCKKLESVHVVLKTRCRDLENRVFRLNNQLEKEQADVAALQGRSLGNMFRLIVRRLDTMLEQEKAEVYALELKLQSAKGELENVRNELSKCNQELKALKNSGSEYDRLLKEKSEMIQKTASPTASRIFELECLIRETEGRKSELSEAAAAGKAALCTIEKMLQELDNSLRMCEVDYYSPSFWADSEKYSSLDCVDTLADKLSIELERFRCELADIHIPLKNLKVGISAPVAFLDLLLDGLFVNLAVESRAQKVRDNAADLKEEIKDAYLSVEAMLKDATAELENLQFEWTTLIHTTQL